MRWLGPSFVVFAAVARAVTLPVEGVVMERSELNQPALKVVSGPAATADARLMEAQGYVEAQDRFVQMDILRRIARGRLAEVLGEKAVPRDLSVLSIGLPQSAHKSARRLQTEARPVSELFEAFARGVNRYLAEMKTDDPLLALYAQITGDPHYRPTPWEPEDSVATGNTLIYYLSSALQEKLTYGFLQGAFHRVGKDADFASLFDLRPLANAFILSADPKNPLLARQAQRRPSRGAARSPVTGLEGSCPGLGFPFSPCVPTGALGSNNWVVSPQFAGGNSALLANDPHLPLTFPTTFYEIALDSSAMGGKFRHVRGLNTPGIPGLLLFGHNDRIAWGTTNQPANVDDVYLEKLNPAGDSVFFRGHWVKLETHFETLAVRQPGGKVAERQIPIRWVPHHGPLFSDYFPTLQKAKVAASYRWVGHKGTTEGVALLEANWARNFTEFRAALDHFEVAAQNVVFADIDGNIGYYSHADYPLRDYLSKARPPFVPVPGQGEFEWKKDARGQDLYRTQVPEMFNPAAGRIVTANNDPFGYSARPDFSDYADTFGFDYSTGIRAQRITELLDENRGRITVPTMEAIQFDHRDLTALAYVGLLAGHETDIDPGLNPKARALLKELVSWPIRGDAGLMDRDSTTGLKVYAWIGALAQGYYAPITALSPELGAALVGPAAKGLPPSTFALKTLYHKLRDGLAGASPAASRELLASSLVAAARNLEARGEESKPWDAINRLTFSNPLEGLLPNIVDIDLDRDGSGETVDVSHGDFGPNFRMVLEIPKGGPITGQNVLPGGNYNPMVSDDWNRELTLWLNGEHRPLVPFVR